MFHRYLGQVILRGASRKVIQKEATYSQTPHVSFPHTKGHEKIIYRYINAYRNHTHSNKNNKLTRNTKKKSNRYVKKKQEN